MKLAINAQVTKWVGLWNNRPFGPDKPPAAPAYVQGYGLLVSGLMQAQPPVAEWETEDEPFTSDQLADLIDEVVPPSAGMGVSYMRPIPIMNNGDDDVSWRVSVETPENVIPVWSHHRLVGAVVWTAVAITNNQTTRIALVERWDNLTGSVTVALFKVDHNNVATELNAVNAGRMVKDDQKALIDSWIAAVEEAPTVERRLIPFVWRFEKHAPAPIYSGSEGLVEGLIRLNDQEQDDGEMARHRLIIDDDLISYSQTQDPATNNAGKVQNTFTLKDNLLRVKRSQLSAQAADSSDLIKPVTFPDSLIQRERIERRENSALEAIGINPQSVGRSVSGRSDSAAAKRADQQMTTQTVSGPARRLTLSLEETLTQLATLNEWPELETVTVYEGLKPDAAESADTTKTLSEANAASTETLVRTAHPTWTPTQVQDELDRMAAEGLTAATFTE